ncbi:protein belonging to Uncharacterized protein family UPF0147, partial [mine drainage metagenome]
MTAPSPSAPALGAPASGPAVPVAAPADSPLTRLVATLAELADDVSVPRNVRRGAQAAKEELTKGRVALDVRIASAVAVLDDLANDPNVPT